MLRQSKYYSMLKQTPEHLSNQGTSWHHSCRQKFTQSRPSRAREKKRKSNEGAISIRHSKRQSLESKPESCILCTCVTPEKIHEYSTRGRFEFTNYGN